MKLLSLLLFSTVAFGQTLGQLRLVDFSPRTAAVITNVTSASGNVQITYTPGSFTLTTGTCIWVYLPMTQTQDAASIYGNLGRGYFCPTIVDSTHITLTTEMYSGLATSGNGTTRGDKFVPLTVYYLRDGPVGALDGPQNVGTWNNLSTYKALQMVNYAVNGNSYVAMSDNTGVTPTNPATWRQVDPTKVGPGTILSFLRSPAASSSYSYGETKSLIDTYFPANYFDWNDVNGSHNDMAAVYWAASGNNAYLPAAQRIATQLTDLADGSVACDVQTGVYQYCNRGTDMDYTRLHAGEVIFFESIIDWTLTQTQRQSYANQVLNDNSTDKNGWDTSQCAIQPRYQAAFSAADQIKCGAYDCVSVSGNTHFTTLPGFGPGSILIAYPYNGHSLEAIGRVATVDSDTEFHLVSSSQYNRAASATAPAILGYNTGTTQGSTAGANLPWYYTPPWDDTQHWCGLKWWVNHHLSSPSMIPGEESHYAADYNSTSTDFSRVNNRTISALLINVSAALQTAGYDIRGVTAGEMSINYFMTQWMAQNIKSRWAFNGGHGNQYGPGRVYMIANAIAWMLKNSLTVTPPGILTGNWMTNNNRGMNYEVTNTYSTCMLAFELGYAPQFNGDMQGCMEVFTIGQPMLMSALLFPSDPSSGWTWDYFRNRRGDYGIGYGQGGWTSFNWQPWGLFLWNPPGSYASITTAPLQQGIFDSDVQECINAGLYCLPDAQMGAIVSTTGWSNNDRQWYIGTQSTYPMGDWENYGTGSSQEFWQNSGTKSAPLIGGQGLNFLSSASYFNGQMDGSGVMLYSPTTHDAVTPTQTAVRQYLVVDRWAGNLRSGVPNNDYVYARLNMSPMVHEASNNYTTPFQHYWFNVPSIVTDEVIDNKNGSNNPAYLVTYDSFSSIPAGYQLRHYWAFLPNADASTFYATGKHIDWVTTNYPSKNTILTNPTAGRAIVQGLHIPGSANVDIAMMDDNYTPPPFSGQARQDLTLASNIYTTSSASCTSNVVTLGIAANVLVVGQNITVAGYTPSGYNGTYPVLALGSGTVSYGVTACPAAATTFGTVNGVVAPTWSGGVATFKLSTAPYNNYALPTDGSASISFRNINFSITGSLTGAYPVTAYNYNAGLPIVNVTMPVNPGTFLSMGAGTTVSYPAWCSYINTGNFVASCRGNYPRPTSFYGAGQQSWPGTYRVSIGASTDGTNLDTETAGELLSVVYTSPSTTATMPPLQMDSCTGNSGVTCLTLEIQDVSFPRVNIMARNGGSLSAFSTTTSSALGSSIKYIATGMSPGTYSISKNGTVVASTSVVAGDTTMEFVTGFGSIVATQTGSPIGFLNVSPSALSFVCSSNGVPSSPQTINVSETNVTMTNATANKTQNWLTISPTTLSTTGNITASISSCPITPGSYNDTITISTTDGVGNSPQTVSVSLTVYSPPAIATTSLPAGTQGTLYNQTLSAVAGSGLSPYAWSVQSGSLPTSLFLSGTGVLSGTPSAAGSFTFTVLLTDSQTPNQTATQTYTVVINPTGGGGITLNVSPSSLTFGCVQNQSSVPSQNVTLSSSGGTANWTASDPDPWLIETPNSGLAASAFAVSVSCTGLTQGTYTGNITISSTTPGVSGPVQVFITLNVLGLAAPIQPSLQQMTIKH